MIIATVKGDVHDIGKNLVDIILSNNGFEVINLGIKVPPQDLIEAVKKHHPDFIGLSGLLVKSAQHFPRLNDHELPRAARSRPSVSPTAAGWRGVNPL